MEMALALAQQQVLDDEEAEAEDARVVCDPAITVADLEESLERYFEVMGYRNVQEVLDTIRDAKVSWRTAPKARAWDMG